MSRLAESPLDLSRNLERLEAWQLIRALPETEPIYSFKHNLVQQVAYESMLAADRRSLHRHVGETLEHLFPDRLPELAEVLGSHFERAGDVSRALHYTSAAAEQALRRFATSEAADLFARAITLAGPSPFDEAAMLQLYQQRARALELGGRYKEALTVYGEMERLGRDRASSRLELYGVIGAASLQAVPTPLFDPEAGLANADRALALAEASGDVAGQAKAHWLRMLVETRHNSRAAVAAGLASLELARRYGLREQEAFTLNDIQSNYQVLGQPEAALRALDEARPIWESLDNLPMLADNLASAAMLYSLLAEYDAAFERARQSLAVSDRTGNLWGQSYARIAIGVSHFARGDLGEAIRQLTLCVELAERAGFLYPQVAMQSLLAIAYGQAGELRRAEARARRVREVEQANPFPGQVSGKATLGWVAVQRGELEAAERWLQGLDIAITSQSISMLDSPVPLAMADSAFHLARRDFARALESIDSFSATFESFAWRVIRAPLLLARGRALAGLGRPAEARQVFETARVEMAAKGFEAGLWEVEAELAALHHAAGDPLPASELSRSAAAHLTAVADGLSDLGLKESFLAQPRVRSILELAASLAP